MLGVGQFGVVCKAVLSISSSKLFACKVIDLIKTSEEDISYVKKEIKIHRMVKSDYCVCLHKSIETIHNMYMIQDYCNGLDLAVLLRVRK